MLDALGMSDLDYTGSRALAEILDELDHEHIAFAVARAGQHACDGLRRSGLLARIGEDHLFASVDEAVQALGPSPSPGAAEPYRASHGPAAPGPSAEAVPTPRPPAYTPPAAAPDRVQTDA